MGIKAKIVAKVADTRAQIRLADEHLREIRRTNPELFRGGKHRK